MGSVVSWNRVRWKTKRRRQCGRSGPVPQQHRGGTGSEQYLQIGFAVSRTRVGGVSEGRRSVRTRAAIPALYLSGTGVVPEQYRQIRSDVTLTWVGTGSEGKNIWSSPVLEQYRGRLRQNRVATESEPAQYWSSKSSDYFRTGWEGRRAQ